MLKALNVLIIFGGAMIFLSSCASPKKIAYFNDIPDSGRTRSIALQQFKDPIIQPDDILNITIQTLDPQESVALNQQNSSSTNAGGSATVTPGYLVDKNGNVEIQMLGIVKVSGLTTDQARDTVLKAAVKYNTNPTVQVRFANYKVNVIGEVVKPGVYVMPNEKVSVIDAISMAGDLTIYGRRDNVMLIREDGSKKTIVRLNLTNSSFFQSPYFYLKQNDVIYIEPSKARADANSSTTFRITTIAIAVATLLVTLFTRI